MARNTSPYPGTAGSSWDFYKVAGASNVVDSCLAEGKLVMAKGGRSCPKVQIKQIDNYYVWADFVLPESRSSTQIAFLDGGTWKGWGLRCYSLEWKGQSWTCNDGTWRADGVGSSSTGAWCNGQNDDFQDNLNVFYGPRPKFSDLKTADAFTFDADYYASKHPDLCLAFGANKTTLLDHYWIYGVNELRQATPGFNPRYYLDHNPDVVKAFGYTGWAARYHWYNYGQDEGRRGAEDFDATYYMDNNPDVKRVYPGAKGALVHWPGAGIKEGRRGALEVDFARDPPRCGHLPAFNGWPAG